MTREAEKKAKAEAEEKEAEERINFLADEVFELGERFYSEKEKRSHSERWIKLYKDIFSRIFKIRYVESLYKKYEFKYNKIEDYGESSVVDSIINCLRNSLEVYDKSKGCFTNFFKSKLPYYIKKLKSSYFEIPDYIKDLERECNNNDFCLTASWLPDYIEQLKKKYGRQDGKSTDFIKRLEKRYEINSSKPLHLWLLNFIESSKNECKKKKEDAINTSKCNDNDDDIDSIQNKIENAEDFDSDINDLVDKKEELIKTLKAFKIVYGTLKKEDQPLFSAWAMFILKEVNLNECRKYPFWNEDFFMHNMNKKNITQKEIAQKFGLAENNASQRFKRFNNKIKELLNGKLSYFEED